MHVGTEKKIKKWLNELRKVNSELRTREVTVTAEPSVGPEAFSVKLKGDELRDLEIYALKGTHGLLVKASWILGEPISDATFKQLLNVVKSMLDSLP